MNLDSFFNTKDKDYTFTITKKFNTSVNITPRKLEVASSFGLGIDDSKDFTVFEDFVIGVNKNDRVYITGDSGGGKSLLLKELRSRLEIEYGFKTLSIDDEEIVPLADEEVIENIGSNLEETIYYLSLAGLNDAFIFLRKYSELSDGQKYRYKLAKMLSKKPNAIFIDEYCANLDRISAKVISFNLKKLTEKEDFLCVVATTHDDLIEDFDPNVLVVKHFMNESRVEYRTPEKKKISFYDDIVIERGAMDDYMLLSKFHYKNTSKGFPHSYVFTAKKDGDLVGVVVYSPPFLLTKGRTIKFDGLYKTMSKENVKLINKLFIRCSRIVIAPKYRACGLGKKLLWETMNSLNYKYIELINLMGKYNPFAEAVGMERVEITEEASINTLKLDEWMKEKELKTHEIHNTSYWKDWVDSLTDEDKNTFKLMCGKVLHHPKIGIKGKEGTRQTVKNEEKRYREVSFSEVRDEIIINIPKLYSGMTIYYIWENPNYKEDGEI